MKFKLIRKHIFIKFSRVIMVLFYDKQYLSGRWFINETKGWKWCWRNLFMQKFIGYNKHIPFPVSHRTKIGTVSNLDFHIDDLNNFQHFGCYFQNYNGKIGLGKGTYIAPNCGLITQNHDPLNLDYHLEGKDIIIGENCWIGMNSIILPGVALGDCTIVGAGTVITKSFEEGNCVIVGNPARVIKKLEVGEFNAK